MSWHSPPCLRTHTHTHTVTPSLPSSPKHKWTFLLHICSYHVRVRSRVYTVTSQGRYFFQNVYEKQGKKSPTFMQGRGIYESWMLRALGNIIMLCFYLLLVLGTNALLASTRIPTHISTYLPTRYGLKTIFWHYLFYQRWMTSYLSTYLTYLSTEPSFSFATTTDNDNINHSASLQL